MIATFPVGGLLEASKVPLDRIADDSSLSFELASIDGDQISETDDDASS